MPDSSSHFQCLSPILEELGSGGVAWVLGPKEGVYTESASEKEDVRNDAVIVIVGAA
jgi:hypothetical protein